MISGFYPTCIDAGISPLDFWDYTVFELKDLVESYNRTFMANQKMNALSQFKQAQMTASFVSLMFASKDSGKEPQIWDFYPELFEEEKQQIEQMQIAAQLELHKARMREFAERTKGKFKASID